MSDLHFTAPRVPGCTCSEQQLNLVGCDCGAADYPLTAVKASDGKAYDVYPFFQRDLKPGAKRIVRITASGFVPATQEIGDYLRQFVKTHGSPKTLQAKLSAVRAAWNAVQNDRICEENRARVAEARAKVEARAEVEGEWPEF